MNSLENNSENYLPKSPKLIVDVDDTILLCGDVLQKFCEERLGRPAKLRLRDYHYVDHVFDDLSHDAAEQLCHEFWESDLMGQLEPEPYAVEVLTRLHARGYKFVAITACSPAQSVWDKRMKNLKDVFGFEWEALHCTYGKTKAEFLELYEPAIWVEDHWHNCQAGAKAGHTSFLFNRKYNEIDGQPPLFTRVETWLDIEAHLKDSE